MLRFREQIVVKRVGASILKNKIKLGLSLNDFSQLCDGIMRKFSQNIDLPFQILDLIRLINLLLLIYLDSNLLISPFIKTHPHDTISPFA